MAEPETCLYPSPRLPRRMSEVAELRNKFIYGSMEDQRYLSGGFYEKLSSEQLASRHSDDNSSTYILLETQASIAGFCRISCIISGVDKIGVVHSICVTNVLAPRLRKKLSSKLFQAALEVFVTNNCTVLRAEVCCFPVPNVASFRFHAKRGFVPTCEMLREWILPHGTVWMLTLEKNLVR